MSYSFIIADELIEDLKTGHDGIQLHVRNRLYGLRNMYLRRSQRTDYEDRRNDTIYYLEIDRIINRLHDNDANGAITMLREFQEFLDVPYGDSFDHEPAHNNAAKQRFLDWQVELNE